MRWVIGWNSLASVFTPDAGAPTTAKEEDGPVADDPDSKQTFEDHLAYKMFASDVSLQLGVWIGLCRVVSNDSIDCATITARED